MRRLLAVVSFVAALFAFAALGGGGMVMVGVENSGAEGAGTALTLAGVIAFACAMFLVFAPRGTFSSPSMKAIAGVAAAIGAAPVGGLAWTAIFAAGFFSGGEALYALLAAGALLAVGALAILALGYLRIAEPPSAAAAEPPVAPDGVM